MRTAFTQEGDSLKTNRLLTHMHCKQVLEPRRVAAKAAARRMAALLCEPVGRTVGYRVKLESRVSSATRIEVVTEGILLRRLQQDPTLEVRQRIAQWLEEKSQSLSPWLVVYAAAGRRRLVGRLCG
jgi:hypothetical protein